MQTKTALVVDDSRVARMTLGKLLKTHDFDIVEQGSAEEAIAWLQQAPSQPDIIFMDVMMTGIDGLTATRQIKADSALTDVPVVICTGKDTEADLEQALATGAAAVLSKPPAGDALQQLLNDIQTPASEPEPEPANEAKTNDQLAAEIQAQLMPEIEQKLATSLAALQQQIDQQQASSRDSQTGFDKLTEMGEQISGSVQQQINELKQAWSSQAEQVVSTTASKAVDSAMDNLGLNDKITAMLDSEGREWLDKQQAAIQDSLQQQLQQQISEFLAQTLDQQLAEKLPVMIESQQQATQQALAAEQKTQIDALQAQLSFQRNMAIGATVIAVAALIVALI